MYCATLQACVCGCAVRHDRLKLGQSNLPLILICIIIFAASFAFAYHEYATRSLWHEHNIRFCFSPSQYSSICVPVSCFIDIIQVRDTRNEIGPPATTTPIYILAFVVRQPRLMTIFTARNGKRGNVLFMYPPLPWNTIRNASKDYYFVWLRQFHLCKLIWSIFCCCCCCHCYSYYGDGWFFFYICCSAMLWRWRGLWDIKLMRWHISQWLSVTKVN